MTNRFRIRIFFVLLFFSIVLNGKITAENIIASVKSPNNEIELNVILDNSSLFYQVLKNSKELVSKSRLGLNTSIGDFSNNLKHTNTSRHSIDEKYTLPLGKRSIYSNTYNEIKVTLNAASKDLDVYFRAYNDGVAFRYGIEGVGNFTVFSEASELKPTIKEKLYLQKYSRDYKSQIEETDWNLAGCIRQIAMPIFVKSGNDYLLFTEAAVNGNYSSSKIITDNFSESFLTTLPGNVTSTLPFQSPWRCLLIGNLNTIIESNIIENLNPQTEIADLSWIKPGRGSWNYGGEDTSDYLTFSNICKYIDWAKEMSWEYFTLDKGWQNNPQFTLQQVINYAQSKGIGVFIWINQNKLTDNEFNLRGALRYWKNLGIKGLKVDFWEDDSQAMMKKYEMLLRLTAEQSLLLNLHSSTKPSGLRRTWPHLLSSEAVLSNSYYATSPNIITAAHNINASILRGSIGSTDYTPVDFANKNGKILSGTTWGHQLALSIIFESGIQHIIDAPQNIKYNISYDFLKNLPVAWDETKSLGAEMDEGVTIARRKGDDWYIASLSSSPKNFDAVMSFLSANKNYYAYIYKDGTCPSEIEFEFQENINSSSRIIIPIAKNGGFAMRLSPSSNFQKPVHTKYEAESPDNSIPFGVEVRIDEDSLFSNKKYVSNNGKGRPLIFKKIKVDQSGTHAVTFYYSSKTNKSAYVKVNDDNNSRVSYNFFGTGSESGSGLGHKTILVELDVAKENSIEFGNYYDFAPNLDRIVISKVENTETDLRNINEDPLLSNVFTTENKIVIKNDVNTEYWIFNSLGQLAKRGSFDGGQVSIPMKEKGIYIVLLSSQDNKVSKKLIVK